MRRRRDGRLLVRGGRARADRCSLCGGERGRRPTPCGCGRAKARARMRGKKKRDVSNTQAHCSGAAALRLPWVTRAGWGGDNEGWRSRKGTRVRVWAGTRAARHACVRCPPCSPRPSSGMGLAGLARAHARRPPEASGCAERARAARRRTCEVSPEESRRPVGARSPRPRRDPQPHLGASWTGRS